MEFERIVAFSDFSKGKSLREITELGEKVKSSFLPVARLRIKKVSVFIPDL